MKKNDSHKVTIWILCIIIIIQWLYIIATRPKKEEVAVVVPPKPPKQAVIKGRIAIVLDDWGYNMNNMAILRQIRHPLTLSVLPNLPYSGEAARQAEALGFEVILHLPMEPYEKFRLERSTILSSMDEAKITDILLKDLTDIKYAKGVSNHMGSKATGDNKVMAVIFTELKKRRLYFLDSFVSTKTIGPKLAKQLGVPFAKRDVFLDNKPDYGYIKGQLYKLKIKAKNYGQAIGIGHDREHTLEVLRDLMPEIEKEGFKFVVVSDLIR